MTQDTQNECLSVQLPVDHNGLLVPMSTADAEKPSLCTNEKCSCRDLFPRDFCPPHPTHPIYSPSEIENRPHIPFTLYFETREILGGLAMIFPQLHLYAFRRILASEDHGLTQEQVDWVFRHPNESIPFPIYTSIRKVGSEFANYKERWDNRMSWVNFAFRLTYWLFLLCTLAVSASWIDFDEHTRLALSHYQACLGFTYLLQSLWSYTLVKAKIKSGFFDHNYSIPEAYWLPIVHGQQEWMNIIKITCAEQTIYLQAAIISFIAILDSLTGIGGYYLCVACNCYFIFLFVIHLVFIIPSVKHKLAWYNANDYWNLKERLRSPGCLPSALHVDEKSRNTEMNV